MKFSLTIFIVFLACGKFIVAHVSFAGAVLELTLESVVTAGNAVISKNNLVNFNLHMTF